MAGLRKAGIFLILLMSSIDLFARQEEMVNPEVLYWFDRNWIWVAAASVILLVLVLIGYSKMKKQERRKTAAVDSDRRGQVKHISRKMNTGHYK